MTFAQSILKFYEQLPNLTNLPKGISTIFPYHNPEVKSSMKSFYSRFYDDKDERYYICGINPGRFGAGITGIPFTDAFHLEHFCGIKNSLDKKKELSSIFMYDLMEGFGSVEAFYKKFYICSVSPIGFTNANKNYNYYDDLKLQDSLVEFIVHQLEIQLKFGIRRDKVFILGKGKNLKFFQKLNNRFQWFEEIIDLPHPRWVMQYQKRNYDLHKTEILQKLKG